ncbi:MAG: hypothetical protein AB8F95_04150 [Bacteroidia bacterium]
MKTPITILCLLMLTICFTLTSCIEEPVTNKEMTEEDAVEIVESAIVYSSDGMVSQVEETSEIAEETLTQPEANCSQSFDSTATKIHAQGSPITFAYDYEWGWELMCNRMIPQQIDLTYSMDGTYSSARMYSEDEGSFAGVITGLTPIDTHFVYNGIFERIGYQESKVRNNNAFNSKLIITTTNLKYNKKDEVVDSGSTTFTLTGDVVGGNSFSFSGTIVFNGNRAATITVNGNSYSVQL